MNILKLSLPPKNTVKQLLILTVTIVFLANCSGAARSELVLKPIRGKELRLGDLLIGRSLNTAIAKIGTKPATLHIPSGHWTLDRSLVIPANVNLRFDRGAILTIKDNNYLNINGSIEAGSYQIFNCLGNGKVTFRPGSVTQVLIRWFGAVGNGTADDTAAVQAAINSIHYLSGEVVGSIGDNYRVGRLTWAATGTRSRFCGNGATLTQAGSDTVLDIRVCDRLVVDYWLITGVKGRRNGNGIRIHHCTNVFVKNVELQNFDKGLCIESGLYCNFENLFIYRCNYAVYGTRIPKKSGSSFNIFTNLRLSTFNEPAIFFRDANTLLFNHCCVELSNKQVAVIKNIGGIEFNNFHVEGAGRDKQQQYAYVIDNCRGVNFLNSHLGMGGPPVGLKSIFRFINHSRAIRIAGNDIYFDKNLSLYSTDGTVTGLSIRGNNLPYSGRVTCDAVPVAELSGNSGVGWITLAPGMVTARPGAAYRDYCKNPSFANKAGDQSSHNATSEYDAATGFDDSHSWKITWQGPDAWARLDRYFETPPAGKYYAVLTLFYKSDTAQAISISHTSTSKALSIPVASDGQWRYFAMKSPLRTNPGSHAVMITSNATSGSLWIDCISLRYFSNEAAAEAWLGAVNQSKTR